METYNQALAQVKRPDAPPRALTRPGTGACHPMRWAAGLAAAECFVLRNPARETEQRHGMWCRIRPDGAGRERPYDGPGMAPAPRRETVSSVLTPMIVV